MANTRLHTAQASTNWQFFFTTPLSFHSEGMHACGRPGPACAAAGMSLPHTLPSSLPSWDSPPKSCFMACLSCGQPRHRHAMHVLSFWRHRVAAALSALHHFTHCTFASRHACLFQAVIHKILSLTGLADTAFQGLQSVAGHLSECFQTMLGSAFAMSAVPT